MSENSTSETKISKYYTENWKEIEKKWVSYGILNENDNSINSLLLELEDPERFLKIKKILNSHILDNRLVMIYLTIFMEPNLSVTDLLDRIKSSLEKKNVQHDAT